MDPQQVKEMAQTISLAGGTGALLAFVACWPYRRRTNPVMAALIAFLLVSVVTAYVYLEAK